MPISPIKANETSMLWLTVLKNMSGFKEAHLSGVFFFKFKIQLCVQVSSLMKAFSMIQYSNVLVQHYARAF